MSCAGKRTHLLQPGFVTIVLAREHSTVPTCKACGCMHHHYINASSGSWLVIRDECKKLDGWLYRSAQRHTPSLS